MKRELAQPGLLSPPDVAGVLGSHTKHALLVFQKAYGLGGGVLDRETLDALEEWHLPYSRVARASYHHS